MDPVSEPMPEHVPEPAPESTPPADVAYDPLAVALGNASLLGVGYLMLGRRELAAGSGAVTIVLLSVLVSVARTWCEVIVLIWWAAVIAHGWLLAGGRTRRVTVWRQRRVALGAAVAVLLVVGLLRFDASRIERRVTKARASGDCGQVLTVQSEVWFGVRVADAPLAARGDRATDACRRLRTARAKLRTGLTGNPGALKAGFDTLASVLAEAGNDRTVDAVLTGFLGGLSADEPCDTAAVTDWLRRRPPSHTALDRSAEAVPRTAPAALVGCGDGLMTQKNWKEARTRYQQLLDEYPGDGLTAKAHDGVRRATQSIELANVRELLDGPSDERPAYCSNPAKYSGARPYGKGTNRAMFFGNDKYAKKLQAGWRTTDPAKAVLVVCAHGRGYGTAVQRCPYEGGTRIPPKITYVTFRKIAIPVKVYELRTGKRVADREVQISGRSCPRTISYKTYGLGDYDPPSKMYVSPSKADVRDGFRSLIDR
jgi:hypothetical protein